MAQEQNYEITNKTDKDGFTPVNGGKKHIIDSLTDYMFGSKLLRESIRYLPKEENIIIRNENKHRYHRNLYIPSDGNYSCDTLFWIFYVLVHGIEKYELLGNSKFIHEKNTKIEHINIIKKNKEKLKAQNIKKHSTCENDLLNEKKISLKTFHMLCVCYDIDFLFLKNRMYYKNECEDKEKIICEKNIDVQDLKENNCDFEEIINKCPVVHEVSEGIYGCEFDVHDQVFKNYIDTRMKIDNYEKPLKSVSSYTIGQLQEICDLIKIKTETDKGKKKTKTVLYTELTTYLTG